MTRERALWKCSVCGRSFANENQTHSCGRHDLAHHFEGKAPVVREIFDAFVAAVRAIGPVRVLPEKTRIAFQVRMSFAQLTTRKSHVNGHVVLARRLEHPRLSRIDTISAKNHVHHFRLDRPQDVDADVRAWLREAYAVGEQKHLRPGFRPPAKALARRMTR